MAEEEHDVYGAEIPDETEMDGDFDSHYDDDDMSAADAAVKEEEATALHQIQATMTKDLSAAQAVSQENKEGVDECSVFVGNVDYACTPEEVQQHFQSYGSVNRVTILTDKFGQPKGFAYVEFSEAEAVQEALALNETELHDRQLKVMPKRTNVPGKKQFRPRRSNPYMGYHFRRPYVPYNFYSPYGYGFPGSEGQDDTCCTIRGLFIKPYYEKDCIMPYD